MKVNDRRKKEDKLRPWLVIATDRTLSNTAFCRGISYCAWACNDRDVDKCMQWVRSRSDMVRVRLSRSETYRPKGCQQISYYAF